MKVRLNMVEYIVEIRVQVEDDEMDKYTDVNDLIYSNTENVPFSFSIENVQECDL
jgi:hypothetical protein